MFLLAAGLVFAPPASASTPEITLSVSRQSATVGDPIDLTLRLRYDNNRQLVAPVIGAQFGSLEVLKDTILAEGTDTDGRKSYVRRLRLVAFRPGSLWTPPMAGELVDSTGFATPWQSDSLLIDIVSVIGDADPDTLDIKALKSLYSLPESNWIYWAISAAILALALVVWWLWRRRKHPETAGAPVPDAPAWEVALHDLNELPRQIDPDTDGGRQWYFRLSEILRRYLDHRYGWNSMDETTSQILRRLPHAPFDNGRRERAREFFLVADRVRYARSPAREGLPEIDRIWVRELVEATIPERASEFHESAADKKAGEMTEREEVAA